MSDKDLNWKFSEEFVVEGADLAQARQLSLEHGIEPITAAMGAQLAVLAAASGATSIAEIGTGVGLSGLWLLRGAPEATLTSIDIEVDYHQSARKVFTDAGIPANRARLIAGRASDVLPRLNDASYDIVFIDADAQSVLDYVEHGLRLARVGGTVIVAHALWRGLVADPAHRDDRVADYRSLLTDMANSSSVVSALSPVGDGLLQITKLAD